ncbi:MAG: hypothetical protein IKK26_05185 [Clostridia bacterium]|nr:hypothetical protein [Clostridia bacterium]MBR6649826.1 hypothetical protein [Clostridia bacterium]
MKKKSASAVVNYLFPPVDNLWKGLIFIASGIIIAILESNIWLFLLLLLLSLFDFASDIVKISKFLSQIRYLKSRKEFDSILEDFESAKDYMDGQLRIGNKYIFGKKSGSLVSYDDIKKIHHFSRKKYGYRKKRFIEVFTLEGEKIKLSKVNDTNEAIKQSEIVLGIVKELAPKAEVSI